MLSPRHRRFADAILAGKTQGKAYEAAGYKTNGHAAEVQGCRLLKKAEVKKYIQARQVKAAERIEISVQRVLQEYARIAFADMRNYADWGGKSTRLKSSKHLTEDEARAVVEVTQCDGKVKIKLHPKTAALEALAKHLGLFQAERLNDADRLSTEELLKLIPEALEALGAKK